MEAVSLGSVFFVQRDSAEDPLDDSGTVQQQLDQVTDKYNVPFVYMKHGGQMVSLLLSKEPGVNAGQPHCILF